MAHSQPVPGTNFKASPGLLYFVQRLVVQQWLRKIVVAVLSRGIRLRRRRSAMGIQDYKPALDTLHRSGFVPLPGLLSTSQVDEIHAFLDQQECVDRSNHERSFNAATVPAGVSIADYPMQTVLACPHILALANHPQLLALASAYIGCIPTISAIILRWSFPTDAEGAGIQAFHRDSDDWRFLKIFIYLTDVDDEAGPHVYVRGTHLTNSTVRLKSFSDEAVATAHGDARIVVTGPRGFGFAADTYGVHKGMVPRTKPRLLLQVQYSLLPVFAYDYQPEPYAGKLPLDRYINRLILTAD